MRGMSRHTNAAGVTRRGDDDGCWSLAATKEPPNSIMLVSAELSLVSTSTTWVKYI